MTQPQRALPIILAALLLASLACQTVIQPLAEEEATPAASSTSPGRPSPAPETPPPSSSGSPLCPLPESPLTEQETRPVNPPHASIGDPYAAELGNLGYDVQRYTLALRLDPARPRWVCGTVTIEARATETIDEFALDFIGFALQSLQVNGEEAEYYRTAGKMVIGLDTPLASGEAFEVRVTYSGQTKQVQSRFVPFEESLGLFFPSDENLYALSEPDGSRYWFPSNDHPRDKALFRFEITTPAGLMATANGLLQDEITEDDATTWVWEHAYPMATYLATVSVGDYVEVQNEVVNGVTLRSYATPGSESLLVEELERTADAISWLEDMVGPYPFEAYGYVTVESGGVTLETQTLVTLSTFMIDEAVLVHELAHMWFGNWVSLDSWGQMWRNEGFATYFEYMWGYRDDPQTFDSEMDLLVQTFKISSGYEPLNDLSPANLFGYESYVKGAALLHALRQEVGDTAFFDGLRLYLERFGGGTASDADFIAVMEETSGRSLDNFFQHWLEE
ncbi:MAG: M1 family metallopeptidase [Chloroflexi bacterium]|nr:M1 family metallopeptidase [Chloroflexota bacterium]